MEFEWDPAKSAKNQIKHGVSFEEAVVIWSGNYISVPEIAYSQDNEVRDATLGLIGDKVYTTIL